MALAINPIGQVFAGEVTGTDCRQTLTAETVAAIEAGMDQYAVLVYPGQTLSDEEQRAFTLHFGKIEQKGRGSGPWARQLTKRVTTYSPKKGHHSGISSAI